MKNYEQLITAEQPAELTLEEREFVEVHRRIVACGELTGRYLFEMCSQIKRMRDAKLYLAAGFEKFEDYTEQVLNVSERQAYKYISVAETYSENYIVENAGVGITKLALLASVTEEEREEITEKIDVKKANKKAVEDAVKAAIRERDEAREQLDSYKDEIDGIREELDAAETSKLELQDVYEAKKKELIETREKVKSLETVKADLEKELAEAKKAAKEVKTVPDEESKKLAESEKARAEEMKKLADEAKARAEELEQKLRETNAQLATARKQKKTIASDDLLTFKVKFNDLQRLGSEIKKALDGMNEENSAKCRNAIKAVWESWKGDMQL